jgi:hypothetical protein
MPVLRFGLFCVLLLATAPALGQDAKAPISGQWQPDKAQNDRLLSEAQDKFKTAVRKARQERGEEGRKRVLRGSGGMGRSPMAGAMGGRGGGRGLRGGSGERGRLSLVDLLPGELNFAAPVEDSLLLHRARDAVLFGRSGSNVVVTVPFDGKADLGNGFAASIRDDNGQLTMQVDTPSGRQVQYRYSLPATGGLQVDIGIDNKLTGSVELQRVYRRVQVDVGTPQDVKP